MNKSSIFFNGRVVSIPGSYTIIDATGLEQVGLGATGIVAIIGSAEGGRPVTDIEDVADIPRATQPQQAKRLFRSGDLLESIGLIFNPSVDPAILAGAQEVLFLKTNSATQSSAVLTNDEGNAIDLESLDYGAFTEQINVSIAPGTTQGKLVSIRFEDVLESADNIGGDDIFQLRYNTVASTRYQLATALSRVVTGGSVEVDGTAALPGNDAEIGTQLAADGKVEVLSALVGDTRNVEIYGIQAVTGNAVRELVTLNGVTPVESLNDYTKVLGARVSSLVAGASVTVRATGGGATILDTFGADTEELFRGGKDGLALFAAGAVTLVGSAASTADVILAGLDQSGTFTVERLTLNGTTPVVGTVTFSRLDFVSVADVAAAVTVTASWQVAKSDPTVQNTVLKLNDFFNTKTQVDGGNVAGFVFTLVTGVLSFNPNRLDVTVIDAVTLNATVGFKADLDAVVSYINNNSQLVEATASAGASGGAPADTAAPIFLTGGSEGLSTFANFQTAINLLKQVRVNTVVPLSGDPAIHSAVEAHCAFMGGIGRSERDAKVGLLNTTLDGPATKDEIVSQIIDLNSRHVSAIAQNVERFNDAGERQVFDSRFAAVILAGMQAGSPVATSLTFKFANLLGFSQSNTWNPVDDAEELVQAGLVFFENVEGVGRRVVRNVTTFLQSNNIAFTEASVNEAVNFAAFTFRNELEFAVGEPGFSGTINALKSRALLSLGLLVDAGALTQFRALQIELNVDVAEVSVEIAPTIPINFVRSTLHLVTIPQTAA